MVRGRTIARGRTMECGRPIVYGRPIVCGRTIILIDLRGMGYRNHSASIGRPRWVAPTSCSLLKNPHRRCPSLSVRTMHNDPV
jgi:hypothetical protein